MKGEKKFLKLQQEIFDLKKENILNQIKILEWEVKQIDETLDLKVEGDMEYKKEETNG